MARYKCAICGYIFDEEAEGKSIKDIESCPACLQPSTYLKLMEEGAVTQKTDSSENPNTLDTKQTEDNTSTSNPPHSSLQTLSKPDIRYIDQIRQIAETGNTIDAAMATTLPLPSWDDILFLGTQFNPAPLDEDAQPLTRTIIGSQATKPCVLEIPLFVSHMSFGALSAEAKTALAKGSAQAKTAMCSGEGGILESEQKSAYKYIFEYVPNKYSVTDDNLQKADAIEIKIGQGTKPGMGGHLPGEKVTPEIAAIRGRKEGKDIQSPSRFPEINTKEDLKSMVAMLKRRSLGRPVGIKIAAGHIEDDLEWCLFAEADFVTIDGRGGATGSSPLFLRDASSVPTIYALCRARAYLDSKASNIELIITGGLRVPSDVAKALALGADAVALATAPLIALGCQQYRICGSGNCPAGVATQKPELRSRLDGKAAATRVFNYFDVSRRELMRFARITGHENVHDLSINDLVTIDANIAAHTPLKHAGDCC